MDYSDDIRDLLVRSGVKYKEGGNHFTTRCLNPEHPDKKGVDLKIYKDSGRGYCFACKWTGGLKKIAQELNQPFEFKHEVEKRTKRERSTPESFSGLLMPRGFKKFEIPIESLKISMEAVLHFGVGYCDAGFSGEVDFRQCSSCPYNNFIGRGSTCCEFAMGRVMTPIRKSEKLLSIESRDLTRSAEKKVLYPTGSKVSYTIFNYDNLDKKKPLIVVEGIKSAVKLWSEGFRNVTAIFSNRLKGIQGALISEFEEVVLIPDPGRSGLDTVKDIKELGIKTFKVVDLPEIWLCKDCGAKTRKSDSCGKCYSQNGTYADAYDFSGEELNKFLGNGNIVESKKLAFELCSRSESGKGLF